MSVMSLISTLSRFPLFRGFTPEAVEQIVSVGEVKELRTGETLIAPGISNRSLYLIIEGELQVVLEKGDVEVAIPIPPGECLGEMSLIAGTPTSARVMARTASRLLVLSEAVFWDHLATTRVGVQNILRMLVERLQRNNDALIEKVEKQLKYQLMEQELETAGKIQSDIVPDGYSLFPHRPEVDAFALIDQAREVGGDFYDALALGEDQVYFAIGDVSGKGMPASLLMVRILNSMRLFLTNDPAFDTVIPAVNDWLARGNKEMMFVSVFAGVLNVRTGQLRYVNAGHNPPYVSLAGQPYTSLELPAGPLLGIDPTATYPVSEMQLAPGDSLVLFTDGITEAMSPTGEMFETARVEEALNQFRHTSIMVQVQSLETAVVNFVGPAPQVDDYTLLGIQYQG